MKKIDPNRRDPAVAQEIIELIFPDQGMRYFFNTVLVKAILAANSIDPTKWSVTLFYKERKELIRVNVGMLEVLTLSIPTFFENGEEFGLAKVYMVLHERDFSVPKLLELEGVLDAYALIGRSIYENAPGSIGCDMAADFLPRHFLYLQSSWQSMIKIAANSQRQPATDNTTHSSGIIEYLQNELPELPLKNPAWFRL